LATFQVEDDKAVFVMGPGERTITMMGKFEIPLKSIVEVSTESAQTQFVGAFASGGRVGFGFGFKIPVLPYGGRFSTPSGKSLVAFRDPNKCITVSLRGEDFDRVVLQVDDKEKAASILREALRTTGNALSSD
jgi:hypothetical protein